MRKIKVIASYALTAGLFVLLGGRLGDKLFVDFLFFPRFGDLVAGQRRMKSP